MTLATGFGVAGDKAAFMSKNLTQLSYDISSFYNLPVQEATDKLKSAFSGELEPVRNLGYDLSEARLQAIALSLGIKQSVSSMDQSSKSILRYIALMTQVTQVQGDMARTLTSPANQVRILKQQINLLVRAIGDLLIPVMVKVIPYVIAFVQILKEAVHAVADFLGIEMAESVELGGFQLATESLNGISDAAGSAGNGLKDAADNAKELKKTILGIDELNVLTDNSISSSPNKGTGTGIGASGGLGDLNLPGYDDFLGGGLQEQVDKVKGQVKDLLKVVGMVGAGFAAWKIGKSIFDFFRTASAFGKGGGLTSALLGPTGLAVVAAITEIGIKLKGWWDSSERFRQGVKELTDVQLPNLMGLYTDLSQGFSNFKNDFGSMLESVIPGLEEFMDMLDLDWSTLLGSFTPLDIVLGQIGIGLSTIGYLSSDVIEEIDILGDGISDTTREKMQPFIDKVKELENTLDYLDWGNIKIDDATAQEVLAQFTALGQSITTELSADQESALEVLNSYKEVFGEEFYNDLVSSNRTYYEQQQQTITDGEARIKAIMETASVEKRALTEAESTEINTIKQQMYDTGVQAMTESEEEYTIIMQRLKDTTEGLTLQQASSMIQNAKTAKEGTIQAAEEQYDRLILEAARQKEAGAISEEQYNLMVEKAKEAKEKTIQETKDQYTGIIEETKLRLGENSQFLDYETGEVKSKWDVFCEGLGKGWSDMWTGIGNNLGSAWEFVKTGISNGWESVKTWWSEHVKFPDIKLPHFSWDTSKGFKATGWVADVLEFLHLPTSIPGISVSWYAQGGFPETGEMFIARESGPEMVGQIGRRTAVANNEQIVEAFKVGFREVLSEFAGMSSGGNWTIQIVDENGEVKSSAIVTAAERKNRRDGKTVIPVGG